MKNWEQYIISSGSSIRQALARINELGDPNCVLFATDENGRLMGSLTDGDIRRGLIGNVQLDQSIAVVANPHFHRIINGSLNHSYIQECRLRGIHILPVVDGEGVIKGLFDVLKYKTSLPLHAIVMAGGRGERLMPLTRDLPKPMLKVGNKPIIEHNIDRLVNYGVQHIHISINYLGHIISDYFKDGGDKGININYIKEDIPLGTLGSITLVPTFYKEHILVMNSDLLTNIDFADFYNEFINRDADMAVATVPYHVDLPYAIMEIENDWVRSLKEKPRYTYFANAGIYLIKKDVLSLMPSAAFFNTTDLMDLLIEKKKKLINYPILGYWLDIGKHEDFTKAQTDIHHLNL